MPSSLSDFLTKLNSQVGATSGAVFRYTINPDGAIQILRSVGGVSGVSTGGPLAPWTILYSRVLYDSSFDRVSVSDGPGNDTNVATVPATQFLNGLN